MLGPLLLLIGLIGFVQSGLVALDGFVLDLGELDWPAPRHRVFLLMVGLYGGLVAAGGTLALRGRDWLAALEQPSDRAWLWATTGGALLLALAVHYGVLGGMAITDDEPAYRFGAELLLTGRVSAPPPPLPLHFAHPMVVITEGWHPAYFLGFPALLAPFVALGVGGLANPVLAALTIPGLSSVLEEVAGRRWGRAALLVWVLAPMPLFLAGTGLSHTACLCALTWTAWAVARTRSGGLQGRHALAAHGLAGLAFSVAFFVRPVSALLIGGPLLVAWGVDAVQRRDLRAGAAAGPALMLATLFLAVNAIQNGSPWLPSYVAGADYHAANGFRFVMPSAPDAAVLAVALSPVAALEQTAAGLLRLNFAAFGWPCSFLFLAFARNRLWWAAMIGGLAGAALVLDVGFDTFGPVHYSEVMLPLIVLTALGLAGAARRHGDQTTGAVLLGLFLVSLALYWPVRAANAHRIAGSVERPIAHVEDLDDAVVFAMWPFSAQNCDIAPTRHLRLARPLPHPDLVGPVVWANHITLPSDRRLVQTFPGRTGYLLFYDTHCDFQLVPLDSVPDGEFPAGFVGGNGDLSGYE
ncbi:MAG: hypothetical protein KDA24_18490 [Deltaproteobacteria bacterium]|nr:hypothetical protein [Deltaproteobacteria bacterium]